jgi:pyridoxal phosphate enzyme (YggS family)
VTCTEPMTSLLRTNLNEVRSRIERAARAAGREGSVQLLPVTKAVPIEVAAALASLGETELAENRADGLERKAAALPDVRWHFIGHLQRNKARRVVRCAHVLHSVDSPRLAEALARLAEEEERDLDLYLQVDFTGEATKQGMGEADLLEALELVAAAPRLRALGLMAMAPLSTREGHDAAAVFARVTALAARLHAERPDELCTGLSMGMSADLEVAVAAGSTCVRVGTDLYRGLDA